MLIVLEGPDGGGKSSLAAALAEHWQSPAWCQSSRVIHTGPPADPSLSALVEYQLPFTGEPLASEAFSQKALVILDRWHAGDAIYGPLYRGFSRLTPEAMLHTEMVLQSLGAVRAMCLPPLEVIQRRVARDGDDYINQKDLPVIWEQYRDHAERHGWFVIDGAHDPVFWSHRTTSRLASLALRQAPLAGRLHSASAGTYTGSVEPLVIFAGERLGGSAAAREKHAAFTRPFTPVTGGGSSSYLLAAILAAGDGIVNKCGLVNACHPGADLPQLRDELPSARWVALGANASEKLTEDGVAHATVPHPQYVKRFHYGSLSEYAAELAAAARS